MASAARYALVLLLLAASSLAETEPSVSEEVPPSPFAPFGRVAKPRGRWGSVLLLGGEKKQETLTGRISFTYGRLIRVHDTDRKDLTMVRPAEITAIDVEIEKESVEEEWTWKEMGNDEKIKTGRTYPDRTYCFTLTLKDARQGDAAPFSGQVNSGSSRESEKGSGPFLRKVKGHVIGVPVYVTGSKGKTRRVILRTHQRGGFGARLEDLVYVARVAFHDEGTPSPWPVKEEEEEKDDDGRETGSAPLDASEKPEPKDVMGETR